jgi:D-amino-acid dehydrogenase
VVGVKTHQKHCCRPEFENADGSVSSRQFTADAYVFCIGAQAASEELPSSLSLPVYPVKSYSMTAPTLPSSAKHTPTCLVLDNERRVYYTPLTDR